MRANPTSVDCASHLSEVLRLGLEADNRCRLGALGTWLTAWTPNEAWSQQENIEVENNCKTKKGLKTNQWLKNQWLKNQWLKNQERIKNQWLNHTQKTANDP